MAITRRLHPEAISDLSGRIANLVARHDTAVSTSGPPELAESFAVHLLSPGGVKGAARRGRSLARVIRTSGRWHHQIYIGGKPVGFARSEEPGRAHSDWSVNSVFVSDLAAKIEAAVQRIDAERPDDKTEVRLVDFPAHHMHLFMIESPGTSAKGKKPGKNEVFVIGSPFSAPGLEEGRFYSERKFLRAILAKPLIRGLIHKPAASRRKSKAGR